MLKMVIYKGQFGANIFDIHCWEGTSLGEVWNTQKQWFLPGDKVTITDNHGVSRTFTRGVKG